MNIAEALRWPPDEDQLDLYQAFLDLRGPLGRPPPLCCGRGVRRRLSSLGAMLELCCAPDFWPGVVAGGTIHRVAFRTANDEQQRAWRDEIAGLGLNVTPQLDHRYFQSIYYREPGGVLFEIATDGPDFTVDEAEEQQRAYERIT